MMGIRHKQGFTLIELIIVVLITGILMAIVIPRYQQYRIREGRMDVQSTMAQIAQRLAAYKMVNNNYSTTLSNSAIYGSTVFPQTGTKLYDLNLVVTVGTWTLTATPAGRQVGNGNLVLNSQGLSCWSKAVDSPACIPTPATTWDGN